MPTLADCLRKSRLPSGVKTHLRQQARDGNAAKAVKGYLAVVDGNIEALREGARLEAKPVRKKRRPKLTAQAIADFEVGRDKVVRRGDRAFVVDTKGERADTEVAGDAITEENLANLRKLNPAQLDRMEAEVQQTPYLSNEGKRERIEAIREIRGVPAKPPTAAVGAAGARRGLIGLDPFTKTVEAGLKAGKWTIDQTRAAARWLWLGQGSDVSLSKARTSLIARFGEGIKRFVGRIWKMFRGGMRGIGDFFAGPADTAKLATKPAPREDVRKLTKAIRAAKPIRRQFEEMKAAERSRRAAVITSIHERVGGEEALLRSLSSQKGEFDRPSQDLESVGDQFTQEQRDGLMGQIWSHPLLGSPQERMGIENVLRLLLDYGALPTDGQIAKFEIVFGQKFARTLLAKRHSILRRALWFGLDIANVPRALKASWDLSATLRQGGPLSVSYPGVATGAFASQLRAFGSESYAQSVDAAMRADEDHQLAQKAGLFLPHISGTVSLGAREEAYMSSLIQKIPIVRVAVRPSERSFVTYLNQLRFRVFKLIAAQLRSQDKPSETHMREYKRWAATINAGTGRGNIDFGDFNVALNALFFAPRLQVGRFEYPGRLALQFTRPLAIKVAARQIVASLAFPLVILGFLKAWSDWDDDFDAKVEYDPRSTDFGRVQIGDRTAVDVSYGFGSNARFLTQEMTRQRKQRESGKIIKADRWFTAKYWLKGKLAPVPGTVLHIVEGKRFGGAPLTLGGVAADLTVPITVEQLFEAVDEHGQDGLWLMGPEIVGLGVYIRPEDERRARRSQRTPRAPRKARVGR